MDEPLKPKVYITRKLPDHLLARMASATDMTYFAAFEQPVPRAELLQQVQGMDGILSTLTDRIDAELLDAAGPQLKVVANLAVGYDNVDVHAARARGICVTNTPEVLTETTADLTFALMLATARRLPESERVLRAGAWGAWHLMFQTGQDVYGATLGIIGMGRIGEAVARRARGFEMNVLYHNRHRRPDVEASLGCIYQSLDDLLCRSDFVVVLAPLAPDTRGLIGARELALMKPSAILVNTARGPVVDEQALVAALSEGRIWGAGLDVYEVEPLPSHHPLRTLDNVVLLPHIGSGSIRTRLFMAERAVDNLLAGVSGQEPPHRVV